MSSLINPENVIQQLLTLESYDLAIASKYLISEIKELQINGPDIERLVDMLQKIADQQKPKYSYY